MNKILLFFILLSFSFFLIPNVYAINSSGDYQTMSDQIYTMLGYKCNNSACTSTTEFDFSTSSNNGISNDKTQYSIFETSSLSLTTNGALFGFRVGNNFVKDYTYSVTVLFGSNSSRLINPSEVYVGSYSSWTKATKVAYSSADLDNCDIAGNSFSDCGLLYVTFTAQSSNMYLYIRTSPASSTTYKTLVFSGRASVKALGKATEVDLSDVTSALIDSQKEILSQLNSTSKEITDNANSNKNEILSNQNSNAQEIQENQDKNTDKLLNADSESSFKGDGGATSNYNQAEEDLMESIDVNVDDLDLDFSPFLKPFSWIWEQVDKLLNLNSKLFSTVITVLTFGFIGLVINRG